MNRAQRRDFRRRWLQYVKNHPDIPEDTKDLAPLILATAIENGGTFTDEDVLDASLSREDSKPGGM